MKRHSMEKLLLQLLQPLPAVLPFWLALLQQLALTLLLLFADSRRDPDFAWGDRSYLIILLIFDGALGFFTCSLPAYVATSRLGTRCSLQWLLHSCLLAVKLTACLFVLGVWRASRAPPQAHRFSHLFLVFPMADRASIHMVSCCVFLTPAVFLSFAAYAYLYSEASPGGPIEPIHDRRNGVGALRDLEGASANRLMTLANLTVMLTIDLLDLSATFSSALVLQYSLRGPQGVSHGSLLAFASCMLVLVPTAVFLLGFAFPTDLHARGPPNSSQGTTGGTLGRGPDRRRYWVPSGKPAVGSDMFLTAKHAFIVGFFLIDIPGLAFRMALLLHGGSSQGTLLCPFLLKNLTWICLRPLQMHQCVLAEKEDASCHQREVLTVATDVPRQIRAAICATGCPATGADGVPTRRDGVGIPPACCFEEPGLPAAAELHQLRNHMGSSSTGDAEDATAVAAAAAAAVRERQQAFLLNLLDIQTLSSLISNEASFYSAPADVAEAHTQDTASPAATVTSAAAGGRGHSASTVSEVQQPAYKRPLQRFMTHGPLRFFMLRTKQQEDQQASAVSDLATGAVTEEPKAPPLGRAFTLSRWKRQHKGKDQHNLFRNYRSVILPPSAVRTGANGPAKNRLTPIRERAATTVAPATTADQQFPLPFSKRLGERLASLRAFRGRRRSTVPSCSKKQGEQQPEQPEEQPQQKSLLVQLPARSAAVESGSLSGLRGPTESESQTFTAQDSFPASISQVCFPYREDPKDLLSRGKSRHPPAHSQQAPQYKPQQQRGDDPASPGKEMIDGALLTFGRRPEKAPRLATGGFSPRGPEQTLDLAQSCTMHRHGHAPCRDGGAAFALEPYDACQGLAETAPTAGTAQSGSCSKIPLGWLQLDTFNPAPAAIYTAPLAAPTAQMNGQKSKQPGDLFPHELSCLASRTLWVPPLRKRRHSATAAADTSHQQQQARRLGPKASQQGQLPIFIERPHQKLLDALRRQQWELLQEGFPVKRIGFSLLLKRLLILLLRPRGRGFAAVTDSGVHISRKQQLLLAFVAIFTHLAKLLLVLHPFISTLIAQQQQLEERLHEEESLVQKAPGELLLMGEGGLLLLILISLLVLLQATLYLCLSVPFLDTLFVAVGGCLSLASLQGLLATIETLFHSPHRSEGPPKRNPGAPGVDIWFIELPVAEILLRLVLCAPPFFSLLQLILPVCSLLCLRSTVACCELIKLLLLLRLMPMPKL
ncbi:hypothetical protein cyc_01941 [Cyclospora cayetanensis]|uniref:Uncharacterized protein n=1 Tax=Cyclospora cayetanensis TaxID=88456 RepID=A0A1D3CVP2_9EIME|nr:hypothetical protein cyc_01941 [Cyclospora cayetanensis]